MTYKKLLFIFLSIFLIQTKLKTKLKVDNLIMNDEDKLIYDSLSAEEKLEVDAKLAAATSVLKDAGIESTNKVATNMITQTLQRFKDTSVKDAGADAPGAIEESSVNFGN